MSGKHNVDLKTVPPLGQTPNPAAFKPGHSGNPAGRPKGSLNKTTQYRKMIESNMPQLIQAAMDKGLNEGNFAAIRLLLDKSMPNAKPRDEVVKIPGLDQLDINEQAERITEAVAKGDITPAEGSTMMGILQFRMKIHETTELEERIQKLEQVHEAG